MKKFLLTVFAVLTAFFAGNLLIAAPANAKNPDKNAQLIARGKKLFFSKSIGTNGFSCATCHVYSAGTYINLHGRGMVIRPVKNAAKNIAAFNKIHHTRMTVGEKDKMCVRFALKGRISKAELEALNAYVDSLK
jgi:cytochrome c peroxidase